MNVKKIALLVGSFYFVSVSASESNSFSWGGAFQRKHVPVSAFVLRNASYLAFKESFYAKMVKNGVFDRLDSNDCFYGDSNVKTIHPLHMTMPQGTDVYVPKSNCVVRSVLYVAADQLVAPAVFNSSKVQAAVKNFSPETQREIKDTATVVVASALAKSAEALYDNQCNNKPLQESAQEFALNAGTHVTTKVVYHSLVKPVIKEVVAPGLEPAAEFATGYATVWAVSEGIKFAASCYK